MQAQDLAAQDFGSLPDLITMHARHTPERSALQDEQQVMTYGALDALMNRVAASLQNAGVEPGQVIALCAPSSVHYAAVFLGALRAGVVVAPLSPSATPDSLQRMLIDAEARLLFTDEASSQLLGTTLSPGVPHILFETVDATTSTTKVITTASITLADWLAPEGTQPASYHLTPGHGFNIIYSSGTTGEPKGIVQSHGMRWAHIRRGAQYAYGTDSVALLSTPLYSNTTLVVFLPTLAWGGLALLMPKFDAANYLRLAQTQRVSHTMLVPVQYQRLMAQPQFDSHDLTAFRFKFSTSAPFDAMLKADVLKRWPGALIEFYGMTEGGGTCILEAHLHPDKLHTVGRPAEGHDIRLIDEAGQQLPLGSTGEVVGHSPAMMTGYHKQAAKTRAAEWFDSTGKRFIRTGDVGRFDSAGFLTLLDRKKDMVISGGFNIYPSDLEAVLQRHPAVAETAVVAVASKQWGETPVAFVVRKTGYSETAEQLLMWSHAHLGKMQRLSDLRLVDELPRSAIGKVLKRELRDSFEILPTL
jgi:acyl-CoA synthetase (AMP-forming)/AMP-acid ligase II